VGHRGEQGEPPRGPADWNGLESPDGTRVHPAAAIARLNGSHASPAIFRVLCSRSGYAFN